MALPAAAPPSTQHNGNDNGQRRRLFSFLNDAPPQTLISFFLFGLINNVLFVIILSAALDLVGPLIPKGVVLLADTLPSFAIKLAAPYFFHLVPYPVRIVICVALSFVGMQVVAWGAETNVPLRLFGIVLASLSSGIGEITFLQLTHFHPTLSLAFFSSGTGGAGILGGFSYLAFTTYFGWSVPTTLNMLSFLPFILAIAYFFILPSPTGDHAQYAPIAEDEDGDVVPAAPEFYTAAVAKDDGTWIEGMKERFHKSKALFMPYMLPLFIVYIAEYLINQGVAPTLLFPLEETPFHRIRDAYPTYATIYQLGVFLSRSSTPFYRLHNLYAPSLLQFTLFIFLTLQSLFYFLPSVYWIFGITFIEGILGGLVYVNAFHEVSDHVRKEDREFSMAAVGVADSMGVCLAGVIALGLEPALCRWQVADGRPWCGMK
ncbi:battenin CLN3 protein [Saitoella coloradoensis]